MKNILLFLFLLLPFTSLAEEADDGMTTIFEEHFDGWLYTHTSGMNATYEAENVSLQTYKIKAVPDGLPCLKINSGSFSITVCNNIGASGSFILSFKDYNKNTTVSVSMNNTNKKLDNKDKNKDGTYTIDVKGAKQLTLSFKTDDNSSQPSYIDDIVLKAPTSSIRTTPSADLSFNQSKMEADVGTTYSSSSALSNPYDLPIKWFSSNQAIATVDESGNVTPHFIGTTTIYAIFEGNNDFAYQTASYQLTTKREPLKNEVYYDGFAEYIGTEGNGGDFKGNEYVGDYNFTNAFAIDNASSTLYKGYQCLKVEKVYTIKDLEKIGVKNGILNFKYTLSSNKSSKTSITVTLNNEVVLKDTLTQKKWTDVSVPISSSSQLNSITFNGKNFFLDEISIISKDVLTIGPTGYATLYYSGRALKVPSGLTAYTMKVENGKIVDSHTYKEGETVPKATAVVIKGKPGEYNLDLPTDEGIKDDDNQLKGSDTKTYTIGNDGDNFYLLANMDGNGVGFYWGEKNGAAFQNGEHKAYLAIPATDIEGSAAKPYYVFTEDSTTAIRKIYDHESKSVSYTLDGRRCPQGFKGIVITNGRKTIKR